MNTLKHDLERAIPHFDTTSEDITALTLEGKRALMRRRTRVGGGLATSGLAVAGVALGVTAMFTQNGQPGSHDVTAALPTAAPAQTVEPQISLASLRQVANACDGFEVRLKTQSQAASQAKLIYDGSPVHASQQVDGEGWVAAQYDCGAKIVRVLQVDERGVVGVKRPRFDAASL